MTPLRDDSALAERGTPQYSAQLIWAVLHVDELTTRGWIQGGFSVQSDQAWASLRGLIVTDHVVEPTHEFTRRKAVDLMRAKPEFAISTEDAWIAYDLLGQVKLEWPE